MAETMKAFGRPDEYTVCSRPRNQRHENLKHSGQTSHLEPRRQRSDERARLDGAIGTRRSRAHDRRRGVGRRSFSDERRTIQRRFAHVPRGGVQNRQELAVEMSIVTAICIFRRVC